MSLDISKIIQYPAPDKEYYKEVFPKAQITIHHTASGGNSIGDMDYLNTDAQGAVNTAFFVDRSGPIYQAFSSKYWSNHLGIPQTTFNKFGVKSTSKFIHQRTVAIELDNWGWLELGGYTSASGKWIAKEKGKFYSYAGAEVKAENVHVYEQPFLGKKYYERYYPQQLASLKDLLIYLCDTYGISREYQENMWKVSKEALSLKNGIFTHVSYRESGKWDCHPYPGLIEMLKSL